MPVSPAHIKYIAFDLGGVLAEVDWAPLKALHEEEHLIEHAFFIQNNHREFSTGKLSEENYFKGVASALSLNVSQVRQAWGNVVKSYRSSASILKHMSRPFVMWSNIDPLHFQVLKIELSIPKTVVEKSTLSFVEGTLKPDPQFFLRGIEKIGLKAEEILFFDDQQKNIDAARNVGIQAIHLPHFHQLEDKLAPFLDKKPQN